VFVKSTFGCGSSGTHKINDRNELIEVLCDLKKRNRVQPDFFPIIQEGIDAFQIATQAVFKDGKMLGLHMYKNLVEYPPGSGTGVVRESVLHSEIENTMKKIGEKLNFNGFLGMDFLIERKTGKFYLIDANPRVPLGFQNAIRAGIDLSEVYLKAFSGEDVSCKYIGGIRTKTLVAHLSWLFKSIVKSADNPASILKQYALDGRGSFPEIFDGRDMLPVLLMPAIFLSICVGKGSGLVNKYLRKAVFLDKTYLRLCHSPLFSKEI